MARCWKNWSCVVLLSGSIVAPLAYADEPSSFLDYKRKESQPRAKASPVKPSARPRVNAPQPATPPLVRPPAATTTAAPPPASPASPPTPSSAEPKAEDAPAERLTGDWGGVRAALEARGLTLEVVAKEERHAVLSGGAQHRSTYLLNVDAKLGLDFAKMLGWQGASASLYGLYNQGGHPSENVGDLQGTSNIETPEKTAKLFECWIQQNFAEDHVSLLVGLHDLNSEFYVTESAALFLNSNFGIGTEVAQTGVNGPSIFPSAAPAVRLRLTAPPAFYVQTAAFGAQAGDPDRPGDTSFHLDHGDGQLLINEYGYDQSGSEKYAFGYWTYTRTFETLTSDASTPEQGISRGYYLLGEHSFGHSFTAFIRYGAASPEVNAVGSSASTGIVATGLLPARPSDRLGLGWTEATAAPSTESTVELAYRMELPRGLALEPDLQIVKNPGLDSDKPAAQTFSIRIEASL